MSFSKSRQSLHELNLRMERQISHDSWLLNSPERSIRCCTNLKKYCKSFDPVGSYRSPATCNGRHIHSLTSRNSI